MDFEWNQGYGRGKLEEIIQLSAVRIPALGGRIESSFNAYIKPTLYAKFSVGARKLPDLALSVASELDFETAYQAFLSWCGEDTCFAAWGGSDFGVLERNAAFHSLPAPRMEERYDLQAAFGRTIGADRCIALESAVSYCEIPETFSYHNALNDAMYTALVSAYIHASDVYPLSEEKSRERKRTRGMRFTEASPDSLTKQFTRRQHGLNNQALRRASCPICGKSNAFGLWYPYDKSTYYGVAVCGGHSRTLCRLTLEQHKNAWVATRTVLAATESEKAAYQSAKKNEPFRVSLTEKQRRSRRRKFYRKDSKKKANA